MVIRTNTGKPKTIYIIVSQNKDSPYEWVYGHVGEKRFAIDIVKELNKRGEINGEIFNFRELKQMMSVNYYIDADLDWLKPVKD